MGGLSRKNGRNGQNGGCGVDGMMWNMVESSQQQDRFKAVCGQFSFSYAKADSAGAALSALVPLDKVETVFDPQNGKMYRSAGSDDRYHHFMKLANGDA